MYKVKEIYYTLQGEGFHAGRPSVFLRFTGCNLWSGREEDRHTAVCQFCDTDFVGTNGVFGGKYTADDLANKIIELWPSEDKKPFVVCTGGEPLLQLDEGLVSAFKQNNIEIAVETNGTLLPPKGIDWVCMSPKAGSETILTHGDELKLVYPQRNYPPERFHDYNFTHFYIQPMDGALLKENTRRAIQYCKLHPKWKLSIQTHKYLGID